MFASNSNNNYDPDLPFPYTNQTVHQLENTFTIFENPTSKQEIFKTTSFSHYPDPFLDDGELFLSHLLYQQDLFLGSTSQAQLNTTSSKAPCAKKDITGFNSTKESKKVVSKKKSSSQGTADQPLIARKRRTGKKDRHSKICTAQGPRDRRMRLSLQAARKFFDLQDMLGFDKASKTIEWLFDKSKTAIKQLKEKFLSQVKHSCNNCGRPSENEVLLEKIKIRKLHTIARESRDKARARARERTREKLIIRGLEKSKLSTEANRGELRDDEFYFRKEEMNYCSKEQSVEDEIDSVSIGDKIFGNYYQNVEFPREPDCEDDFSGFLMNLHCNNSIISAAQQMNMKLSSGDQKVPELDEIDPIIFQGGCSKSNTKQ